MGSPKASVGDLRDFEGSEFQQVAPRIFSGNFRGKPVIRFDERKSVRHYFFVGEFIPEKIRKILQDVQDGH